MRLKLALFLLCIVAFCARAIGAEPSQLPHNNVKTVNHAFSPGEKLTYEISWSTVVTAGIAVMEVKNAPEMEHRQAYHLVSSTHSVGMVERFYPVRDTVESFIDAEELHSISFSLRERHGKKRRERDMVFDPVHGTVQVTKNGSVETHEAPERVQDALSTLYYVRTRNDLVVGKTINVDVHDNGKNWSVEIKAVAREEIRTPAGKFSTIKVRTYPKYEGVFVNKGEIVIWFTDDTRRIPVLMKSKISIGAIVATLTELKEGQDKR